MSSVPPLADVSEEPEVSGEVGDREASGWRGRQASDFGARYRWVVFALTAPILLWGFTISFLADRWIFALWAVIVGFMAAFLVRGVYEALHPAHSASLRYGLLVAVGFADFARLVERHQEILELGWQAVFSATNLLFLTQPTPYRILALAGLLVAGMAAVSGLFGHRSSPRSRLSSRHQPIATESSR